MRGSGIPIWFFIGVLLTIYGAMILVYGVVEWTTANYPAGVQLTRIAYARVVGRACLPHWACFTSSVSSRPRGK